MPLKKEYMQDNSICNVTFILPDGVEAKAANLVGEFNSWDKETTPLQQLQDGTWKVEVKLDAGQEYQYRYLLDHSEWLNDSEADAFIAHPYGGENSVVRT